MQKVSREMQALGQYMRSMRNDFGLSIHEIARRTGMSPSFVSKLENGMTFQTVTVQTLAAFARAYRVPVQLMLERAGFVEENPDGLPGLSAYLKAKYRTPHQAVQDMELAWEIVRKKYLLQ